MKKDLAVARTCYSVWDRAFAMLGPRVRLIRFNVSRDFWCMKDRHSIKKRIVKLAAMAAEATDGRVRIRVDGGCLMRDEQRFLEEGVPGVEPKLVAWPSDMLEWGPAVVEEAKAEIAKVREPLGEETLMQSIEKDEGDSVEKVWWYQGSKPAVRWNKVDWAKRC